MATETVRVTRRMIPFEGENVEVSDEMWERVTSRMRLQVSRLVDHGLGLQWDTWRLAALPDIGMDFVNRTGPFTAPPSERET